jgi:hypothetical protein
MTRRIRHLIASLAVTLAIGAVLLGSTAGTAGAATSSSAMCAHWKIPTEFDLVQGNGWEVYTSHSYLGNYKWTVYGTHANRGWSSIEMQGTMYLTRFDVSGVKPLVEFTIVWDNRSAGVYIGTIDRHGFLTGWSEDRYHSNVSTDFHNTALIGCAP